MKVLGIYGSIGFDGSSRESYIHDASATLFIDGEHVCSIQEERLSGLKYDGRYPEKSIDYVLDELPKEEIDLVIFVDIGLQEWVKELPLAFEQLKVNYQYLLMLLTLQEHQVQWS